MRPFCLALFFLALAGAAPATAERERVVHVGVILNALRPSELDANPSMLAFMRGLRERGWIEGKNLRIHWRFVEQRYERRPTLIDELSRVPVDVLVLTGNYAIEEALKLKVRQPIVAAAMVRPVDNRYIQSLARPGGNLTGVSQDSGEGIVGKQLALLKQAAPRVTRVAVLDPAYERPALSYLMHPVTLAAARALGIEVFHQTFESLEGIEAAIDEAVRRGANGLYVTGSQPFSRRENQERVRRAAERHRLPALHSYQNSSQEGGLLTYSDDMVGRYARTAHYVDRILRGANPAEMPIELSAKYELVVNRRAARAIGLELPRSLLTEANRVLD